MRRRLGGLLLILAAVAFVVALIAGLLYDPDSDKTPRRRTATSAAKPAPKPSPALPLRQLAGAPIVLSFAGTTLPAYARDILREHRAAGVILFGDNVASPTQLRALTRAVRDAGGPRTLICTDQEGGSVRIVPFAAPQTAPPDQGTPALARTSALAAARQLRRLGVNVVLAPVLDVARPGTALASRAYPGGAAEVARLGVAALAGYRAGGIAATAKHFPGLGAATSNTDDASASIDVARAELQRTDLVPFAAAVKAGVPLIMASHAVYPAVDPGHIASQSPAILRGLLRARLRFRGAVITDSLEARGGGAPLVGGPTAAVRSLNAGADLVLLTGPGSYPSVYRRLLAEARRSPAFRTRLAEAAQRARTVIGRP